MKLERCPTCRRRMRRSTQANSRYWLLLHRIAEHLKPEGQSYSAESYHLYFKSRYLGCEDMKLPNGKVLTIPNPSSELDVPEFNDFMTQVEAWAAERDIYLEDVPA